MSELSELLRQAAELTVGGEVCRRLVDHYEAELDGMAKHLSQIYEELVMLYDVGTEVTATLDVTAIVDRAVERVTQLLDARAAVIMLLDDAGKAVHAGSQPPPPGVAPILEWAATAVLERGRSQIVNDPVAAGAPAGSGLRSLLTAPLTAQGQVIGAVHALDKDRTDGFSTEDQMLLETVGAQLGAAIENSRLYHREQQHAASLARALDELQHTYDATLEALSGALDLRDNETEGHARRVTRYTVRIAGALGVGGQELVDIERGALLHDIGKIGVPDAILLKPDRLTDEEWAVMRQHPTLGFNMLRGIFFLAGAAPVVLHHHERFDGGGYPAGLRGDAIPLGARVFAVADTFDAMTSDRPYRRALPYEVAREEIEKCAGSQFDPQVVEAFRQIAESEWTAIRNQVDEMLEERRRAGLARPRRQPD